MSWSGGQGPGAGLLTGVFIWPVGAGDGPTHAVHNVITTGCKRYQEHVTSNTEYTHKQSHPLAHHMSNVQTSNAENHCCFRHKEPCIS